MGTGNDFARTIGVPLDLPGAADVIASGVRRRVDVGTVNDIPFLNVASLGIERGRAFSGMLAQLFTLRDEPMRG